MSRVEVTACDACGAAAPEGYNELWPEHGWYHLRIRRTDGDDMDACSDACLLALARDLCGLEADPLEELFTAPAAVKPAPKPVPKPRAPRKRT